jgi:hypothetical protein
MPNPLYDNGARKGLTRVSLGGTTSSALHFTTAGGQVALGQGAHAGHFVGGGHFTSGQRGRGQGGHSPLGFWHLEQSIITGFCLGMDDLST